MPGDSTRGSLVNEALAHWGAGRLEAALDCYTRAIDACPESHWALFDYYGGRAGVLAQLGRSDESGRQYEHLLEFARQSGEGDEDSNVALARYFLGNHHVSCGAYADALEVVMPSIGPGTSFQTRLRIVQALPLHGLGRVSEAREAARVALAAARGDREKENVRVELASLLVEDR